MPPAKPPNQTSLLPATTTPVLSTNSLLTHGSAPAPTDILAPLLRHPWLSRLLSAPNTTSVVPACRHAKPSTEDSLMAEILKTPRTLQNCICLLPTPASATAPVTDVSVLMLLGDGMNGYPAILHGGMTATLCDEAMGILQSLNIERARLAQIKSIGGEGELLLPPAPEEFAAFTRELKITYLKPVRTPGALVVRATRVKKAGRKEWLRAEVRQCMMGTGGEEGEVVVCAVGEALFIEAKNARSKL